MKKESNRHEWMEKQNKKKQPTCGRRPGGGAKRKTASSFKSKMFNQSVNVVKPRVNCF